MREGTSSDTNQLHCDWQAMKCWGRRWKSVISNGLAAESSPLPNDAARLGGNCN